MAVFQLPFTAVEIFLGERVIELSSGKGWKDSSSRRGNCNFDANYQKLYHCLKKITFVWNDKKSLKEAGQIEQEEMD